MSHEELIIIRDNAGVQRLREYLVDKDIITFDTETTGVIQGSEIIGYSVCAESGLGWYVITAYWDVEAKELKYLETKETAPAVMGDLAQKKLVMHNGVFDCSMVWENYRVSLIGALHTDTMVLAHLVDENRSVGLKELGEVIFGESARKEQKEMKESVERNGGQLTKKCFELYKADADLIAKYGAKDAILTLEIFYQLLPLLDQDGMWDFYYNDESMPLLRGTTYQLNTTGLKVDTERLEKLKKELEIEALQLEEFIAREIAPEIAQKYPGTAIKNTFNIGSRDQLAWLLYEQLGNVFPKVSNAGASLCGALAMKRPYTNAAKREFIQACKDGKGVVWREKGKVWDKKTRRWLGEAKIRDYWAYLSTDKTVLQHFSQKYTWVAKLLELKKIQKLLSNYVEGIQSRLHYGTIHPSFLQHGTTSGRYSSKAPNFQNLPRDDKRIKSCIISRPGKVFVGADYSQLEPRVFASYSQDERLLNCFRLGQDFYSVTGAPTFDKTDCSLFKKDANFFGKKYESLRNKSKGITLSATYGTTASKLAALLGIKISEAQAVIDRYFDQFPKVQAMMLEAHELVKRDGYVESLYGRKRRIPDAMKIREMFGNVPHEELPYNIRNLLNLAVNHRIQSTGASIVNRASIRFLELCAEYEIEVRIVLQVHDEIVAECAADDAEVVSLLLKEAMENAVELPGVELIAEPKIALNLADLK